MIWNNRAVLYNVVAVVFRLSTASSFSPLVALSSRRIAHSTTSLYSTPPKRYLLNYEYIPDVLEKEAAEKFAAEDPYVSGGIVTKSTISEWTVAIGKN
ncbi:hypothetical protein ACHAXM_003125 [Skeletonema potamos]